MVLKKVLGFATTTSFILLVMIAPTATAATTTASLQQQEDNVTTDDPDIPTGPKEVDKVPILKEPIPDNENETDDEDDGGTIINGTIPRLAEPIVPPENETRDDDDGNNVIPDCSENGYTLPCRIEDVVCLDFEDFEEGGVRGRRNLPTYLPTFYPLCLLMITKLIAVWHEIYLYIILYRKCFFRVANLD
jgi:hypothetical protein